MTLTSSEGSCCPSPVPPMVTHLLRGECCPCPVSPLTTHLLRGELLFMSFITTGDSPPQRSAAVHVLYHHWHSPPQRAAAVHALYHHWPLTSLKGSCCPCPVSPLATHLLREALLSMSCITIASMGLTFRSQIRSKTWHTVSD